METKEKECRKCKVVQPASNFYPRLNYDDGLASYCKECTKINSRQTFLNQKTKWFNVDGYLTEKDHFNAAITQYAEVFGLPSLLRHIKK